MQSSVFPTLFTLIADTRAFINNGLAVLPLTVIGTTLIISLMSANYAMLFMLISMILLVPGALFVANILLEFITSIASRPTTRLFAAGSSDLCDLIPPFPVPARVSTGLHYSFGSYWLAIMSFFFGYIISNAVALLRKETQMPVNADDTVQKMITTGESNRKIQAISAMIVTGIFALIVIVGRIRNSDCEAYILSPIMAGAFGVLGWGIYNSLAALGQDRLSDIFGIANRLLSPDSMNNVPFACLPPASSS